MTVERGWNIEKYKSTRWDFKHISGRSETVEDLGTAEVLGDKEI